MLSKEVFLASFSHEKELERAKWYKEDLDKDAWNEVARGPGYIYWIKTFPDEDVPVKVLGLIDMPLSAEMHIEVLHPRNQDKRDKWDQAFVDHEVLETYPDDQGYVRFMRRPLPFPFSDRSFILFVTPFREIDWYGKRAFIQIQKNACHTSKPEGADGVIRATNGGNFTVVIPDETKPDEACKLFFLSGNNYNGWVPNYEWFHGNTVPSVFNKHFANIVEGYKKYFEQN